MLLCACVGKICVFSIRVRYPLMSILGFVIMNLVLLSVTVNLAVCVLGSPVMYCYYAYTCTIITFLRYLFGLRAARLSIQVLSLTCDILVY